ncbi:unnamed protein product [Thelazia callipaeda]|uniref:lysoplasmalogenase n=1 Tax=Thelazia callipaeda TaxID=103827 RepID=A0A0N5CL74_THECL|nr:unnamed protein product [Thelazia callipaeda]
MITSLLAFPYFALVFIFYRQSNGFIKSCDNLYEYWKTLPVLILSILYYFVGSSFNSRQHAYTCLGLLFGAIGDYLIVRPSDGLTLGAIFFAIGHIFYLVSKKFLHYINIIHIFSLLQLSFTYRLGKLSLCILISTILASFMVLYTTLTMLLISHAMISMAMIIIYSLLLSVCVIFSGSLYLQGGPCDHPRQYNNLLRFLGFILFYLSDSAFIIHHVGIEIPNAEKLILITYFMAQYLILCSSSYNYCIAINKHKT